MAKKTLEIEVPVNHPASSVWQAYMKNFQVTLPKVMPGRYAGIEYLEGPPLAPGGEVLVTYGDAFEHYKYKKFKWEAVDHDNFYAKLKIIEGAALGKHFASLSYSIKLLPGLVDDPNSACIELWTLCYEDIGHHTFHDVLKQELHTFAHALDSYLRNA